MLSTLRYIGIDTKWEMLTFVMVLIFLLGFSFEWIEICLIVLPVFGPLLRAGVAVFGLSPAAFLRWARRGWDLSMRDAGTLDGEVLGPGHGRLMYRSLPPDLASSHAWVESTTSSFYGMLDFTRTTGVVRMLERDLRGGNFTLEVEWA